MSHDATNWAIKQRGIKPALKVVLWNLCDRYHPDNGCFPSQDTLADDCEVPRSTLNVYLKELEQQGLIAREQRRARGSNKQERTRYRFPFEPDFPAEKAENPCPETGHGGGEAESRSEPEPSPENGQSRVQNLDSNPVREPVREPINEREARKRGSAGNGQDDDPQKFLRRVKAMELGTASNPWPGAVGSSTAWALKQFEKLTDDERAQAEQRRDDYLDVCHRERVKPVALGVYLRDRKFLDVAARPKARAVQIRHDGRVTVPVLGPVWAIASLVPLLGRPAPVSLAVNHRDTVAESYYRMLRFNTARAEQYLASKGIYLNVDGDLIFPDHFERDEERSLRMSEGYPEAKRLYEAAKDSECRGQVTVDKRFEALKEVMEFVPFDSSGLDAWRQFYAERFIPFPPLGIRGGYFPKGGPERIDDFSMALQATEGEVDDDAA